MIIGIGGLAITKPFGQANNSWTPAAISTDIWLDAADSSTITLNGNNVSQWSDKSGNARHATQSTAAYQPTYVGSTFANNKQAILFDGASDRLVTSYDYTGSDVTLYVVVSRESGGDVQQWIYSSYGGTNTTYLTAPLWVRGQSSEEWATYTNAWNLSGVALSTNNTPAILGLDASINSAIMDMYTNGTRTAQYLTGDRFDGGGRRNYIGAELDGANRFFNGRIGEIIQVESRLTTTVRQKLEGYLAWKWGLESSLPIGHPYKNTQPTL